MSTASLIPPNHAVPRSGSSHQHSVHSLTRVPSAPVLSQTQHSFSSFTPHPVNPFVASGSASSALDLGPAYQSVPDWERVAPPPPIAYAIHPALASQDKSVVSTPHDTYPEAMIPIGESPPSTSGSNSAGFGTSPFAQTEWGMYDHPSVTVRISYFFRASPHNLIEPDAPPLRRRTQAAWPLSILRSPPTIISLSSLPLPHSHRPLRLASH